MEKVGGVQRVFKMASLLKSYVVSENFKTHRKEKVELRVGECLRGEWVNCSKEVRRKWTLSSKSKKKHWLIGEWEKLSKRGKEK